MRNPFARLVHRDHAKPTLRERLKATQEKYARTLLMHRVMNAPLPKAEPAVDRNALVNYATWLFFERRMVCQELYPHIGGDAERFVFSTKPADQFHFPTEPGTSWRDVPAPSTRAVRVLDLVGVKWRDGTNPEDGMSNCKDKGDRAALPHGWPALDAEILTNLVDLRRIEAARDTLTAHLGHRDCEDVPGFNELTDAWDETFDTLCSTRAEALPGLKAKAKALLLEAVVHDYERTHEVAHSLGRDLQRATSTTVRPRADPILAAIEEGRRLMHLCTIAFAIPQDPTTLDPPPEQSQAQAELVSHCRDVLLKIVPTTAAGCAALARFALDFHADQGATVYDDTDEDAVLRLIAKSPLL